MADESVILSYTSLHNIFFEPRALSRETVPKSNGLVISKNNPRPWKKIRKIQDWKTQVDK